MNCIVRNSVLLAACVGLWSCTNDPTGDLGGTPSTILADPGSIFIAQNDTVLVVLEVLDEQGGTIPATFTAVSLDPGIVVTADENFLPEYDADGVLSIPEEVNRLRINVIASDNIVSTTVRVTSGELTLDIPVKSMPVEGILATFSTVTPGLGEAITVTSQSGLVFTAATEVTFEGFPNGIITDLAVDGSTLTFIAIPGTIGAPTFTNVALAVAPDITFDLTATLEITAEATPASTPADFSTTTPAAGEEVTVSAAGWQFTPTTGVVIGGLTAANVSVAADGSTLTFIPRPGSAGIPNFVGLEIAGVAGVPIDIAAETGVTVGATVAAAVPGTDDPATAPVVDLPGTVGLSAVFTDQLSFIDQFYNFNAVADGTYEIELWMEQGDGCAADLDLFTSSGNSATCAHPEHVTAGGITAGDLVETLAEYYGGVVSTWIQVIVTKTE